MSSGAAPMIMTREIVPDVVHETVTTTTNAATNAQIDNLFGRPDVHTETRKVSSVIVEQKYLGEVPQKEEIRYVEVPTIQEEVKYVTKKETREKVVERKVPMIEYVDRVVEVPRIEYVDRTVEIPTVQEVYVDQVVQQIVDRPVERIVEVPVVREKFVERVVEVPGEIIEVPKPYQVAVAKEVFHAVDTEVPIIVAQTIKPVIVETNKQMLVDVMDYEPEVVPVDVHVAKPVASALELVGQTESRHRLVNISAAQYNSILRQLNVHMDEKIKHTLPYVADRGQIQFVDERNLTYIIAPDHIVIEGWNRRAPVTRPLNISANMAGSAAIHTSTTTTHTGGAVHTGIGNIALHGGSSYRPASSVHAAGAISGTSTIMPSGNISYTTSGQGLGQISATTPTATTTTVKQTTTTTQQSLKPMTYQTSSNAYPATSNYQTASNYQTTNYPPSYSAAAPSASANFQTTVGAYRVGVTSA